MLRSILTFTVLAAFACPAIARPPAQHHRAARHDPSDARSQAQAPAASADCSTFYVGGQAPTSAAPAAPPLRIFCHSFYSVGYSTALRDPLWSAEHLTRAMAIGGDKTKRIKSIKFARQPGLTPAEEGAHADYKRPWDRGHMTPANDAENEATQRDTFVVTNIVPQHANLNERLWQYLEASVHRLAEDDGEMYIVTGPVFDGAPTLMSGRIAIPAATFKAIYDPSKNVAIAYIATNEASPQCRVVAVAEVTKETGIDPFPALPADAKAAAPSFPLPKAATVPLPDCR